MITLYSFAQGPNGWKVVIVLEALGLEYETKFLNFGKNEQKDPEFTKYNPNGRIPAIIDHDNGDFVLWESNTIIKYLTDRYDKENKIHFRAGSKDSYLVDQWMTFQVSGQGPYYGQAAHFLMAHQLKLPTAVERYQKEVVRVISVLDGVLANKKYLVGEKATIADFSFTSWHPALPFLLNSFELSLEEVKVKYPHFARWEEGLRQHPAVNKMLELRSKATA